MNEAVATEPRARGPLLDIAAGVPARAAFAVAEAEDLLAGLRALYADHPDRACPAAWRARREMMQGDPLFPVFGGAFLTRAEIEARGRLAVALQAFAAIEWGAEAFGGFTAEALHHRRTLVEAAGGGDALPTADAPAEAVLAKQLGIAPPMPGAEWRAWCPPGLAGWCLGAARAETHRDGTWTPLDAGPDRRPSKAGRRVITLPVFEHYPELDDAAYARRYGRRREGWGRLDGAYRCVDILALDWDKPAKWWRRSGRCTALGRAPEPYADYDPDGSGYAVRLYETPLTWLAAGAWRARGVCLLDAAAIDALQRDPRAAIQCDSLAHHRRLLSKRSARQWAQLLVPASELATDNEEGEAA